MSRTTEENSHCNLVQTSFTVECYLLGYTVFSLLKIVRVRDQTKSSLHTRTSLDYKQTFKAVDDTRQFSNFLRVYNYEKDADTKQNLIYVTINIDLAINVQNSRRKRTQVFVDLSLSLIGRVLCVWVNRFSTLRHNRMKFPLLSDTKFESVLVRTQPTSYDSRRQNRDMIAAARVSSCQDNLGLVSLVCSTSTLFRSPAM